MNFNRLIAFVTAAKHLHVTRAAAQLHITQPALSKQLRLLQSECEAKLYYKKDAGGIELTEKGRMFFARGRKILDDLDALKKSLNLPERPAGHFTVGGTYGLASDVLPLVLKKFQKTHSGVRVTLRASSSAGIAKGIATGDIEIGLLTILPASNRLEIEPYGTHAIIPFVHAGHPYARRRQVSLTEFAAGPLVVRADAKAQCTAEILLRKQGLRANVMYRCETPHAVRVTVRTKLGVGVLFADCLKNELQSGEFKALNVPGLKLEGKSFIAYRKDRPLSSNARDFHALLHETKQRQKTGSAAPTIGVAGGGNETGVWQTLRSDRVISFVRRCQLFARRGALSLAQIAEFPVVIRREVTPQNWTLAYFTGLQNDRDLKWRHLMYCDSFDAVKDAVRSSDYVGIVHEDLLEEDLQRREFKILKLNDTALTAQNYLCYSTQHPLSPVPNRSFHCCAQTGLRPGEMGDEVPATDFLTNSRPLPRLKARTAFMVQQKAKTQAEG